MCSSTCHRSTPLIHSVRVPSPPLLVMREQQEAPTLSLCDLHPVRPPDSSSWFTPFSALPVDVLLLSWTRSRSTQACPRLTVSHTPCVTVLITALC